MITFYMVSKNQPSVQHIKSHKRFNRCFEHALVAWHCTFVWFSWKCVLHRCGKKKYKGAFNNKFNKSANTLTLTMDKWLRWWYYEVCCNLQQNRYLWRVQRVNPQVFSLKWLRQKHVYIAKLLMHIYFCLRIDSVRFTWNNWFYLYTLYELRSKSKIIFPIVGTFLSLISVKICSSDEIDSFFLCLVQIEKNSEIDFHRLQTTIKLLRLLNRTICHKLRPLMYRAML